MGDEIKTDLPEGVELYESKGPDDMPPNAIRAGLSARGAMYVGAAAFRNMTMPATIVPSENCSYFGYYSGEMSSPKLTFLVIKDGYQYQWMRAEGGHVPANAVRLGAGYNGDPFFVGRATIEEDRCVGKIVKAHGLCYVPHKGIEHKLTSYDVLIISG